MQTDDTNAADFCVQARRNILEIGTLSYTLYAYFVARIVTIVNIRIRLKCRHEKF